MHNTTQKAGVCLRTAIFCFLSVLLVSCDAPRSEQMTPARFHQIVKMPDDGRPLIGPLAEAHFWTNMVIRTVMTYASGEVFKEEVPATTRTVGGRYIVGAMESKYYHQTMYSILECDPKSSTAKMYALYVDGRGGESVIESTAVYDLTARTYTTMCVHGEFKETGSGHYTDSKDVSQTLVFKNGLLFMTREVEIRPSTGTKDN